MRTVHLARTGVIVKTPDGPAYKITAHEGDIEVAAAVEGDNLFLYPDGFEEWKVASVGISLKGSPSGEAKTFGSKE